MSRRKPCNNDDHMYRGLAELLDQLEHALRAKQNAPATGGDWIAVKRGLTRIHNRLAPKPALTRRPVRAAIARTESLPLFV
jgi:hypothetical protein